MQRARTYEEYLPTSECEEGQRKKALSISKDNVLLDAEESDGSSDLMDRVLKTMKSISVCNKLRTKGRVL